MNNFPFKISDSNEQQAICVEDKFYTYKYFSDRVSGFRKYIVDNSLIGKKIGVVTSDHCDTYSAIFAIWSSGNTYVPINPYHPADRIKSIIDQAEIEVVFYSIDEISVKNKNVKFVKSEDIKSSENRYELVDSSDADIAYILFTSGSTGIPKGVPVSYGNVRSFIRNIPKMGYDLNETDRFLQMFDLSFDLSVASILMPFMFGGCMFTVSNSNIKYTEIYRLLEEYEINFSIIVPSVIAYLRPYFGDIDLPKMKYMMLSGEAVPVELTTEWRKCCPNAVFQNLYGPSEATMYCVTYTMPKGEIPSKNGIVCIGKPTLEIDAIIVDDNNEIVKRGNKGELLVCGGQVISSYLNNEEKNKEAFVNVDGKLFYRTGDICVQDDDDNFFYLGRKDYQVKIQGFRIELSEIEYHIMESLKGQRTIAFAKTDTTGNAKIIAVVEGKIDNIDNLIKHLKDKMPYYMIPSEIRTMDSFPLNNSGKIDRKEIQKNQDGK